jgi:hypothetical protein
MLKINDILKTQELDRDAMKKVKGGVYRSAKSRYTTLQSTLASRYLIKNMEFWIYQRG